MAAFLTTSWYSIAIIAGLAIVLVWILRHRHRVFIVRPLYPEEQMIPAVNGFIQHPIVYKSKVKKHTKHMTPMQSFVAGVLLATMLFTLIQFDKKLQTSVLTQNDRKIILEQAESFIGIKYVYGAQPNILSNGKMGPGKSEWESGTGFDCSSFTMAVFHNAVAIELPRTSASQAEFGVKVPSIAQMQPGDLLFFDNGGRGSAGNINHVGIVESNDGSGSLDGITMIHAGVYPTESVQRTTLSGKYWDEAFLEARTLGTLTKDVKTPITTKSKTKTVKFNDKLDTYPKTEPTAEELSGKVAASRSDAGKSETSSQFFTNVTSSYEYYDALKWAVNKGVIQAGGNFDWGRFVTRAEIAKMLVKALNLRESPGSTGLTDIDNAEHWVTSYVRTLQGKDIIDGLPDHTFRPDLPVRVEEAGKMLLSATELAPKSSPNYPDVNQKHWFSELEGIFRKDNLIPSNSKGEIKFGQGMERGRAIEMIYRTMKEVEKK